MPVRVHVPRCAVAAVLFAAASSASAATRIANSDFDHDLAGWAGSGIHWASGPDSDGDPRSGVLRWSAVGSNVTTGYVEVARSPCLTYDAAAGPLRFNAALRPDAASTQGAVNGYVSLRYYASADCSGEDYSELQLLRASVPGSWRREQSIPDIPPVYSSVPDEPPVPLRSIQMVLRVGVAGANDPAIEFDALEYGPVQASAARASLVESFDFVGAGVTDVGFELADRGWVARNTSDPLGSGGWQAGNRALFDAGDGAPGSFLGADVGAAAAGANSVLSNWLLTPELAFAPERDCISFRTRQPAGSTIADRAAVRVSTSGASSDVGASASASGAFTTVLTVLNRNYRTATHGCPVGALNAGQELDAGYPDQWCELRLCGLPDSGSGRVALRHSLADTIANGTAIAIDSVRFPAAMPLLPVTMSATVDRPSASIGTPYAVDVHVASTAEVAPAGRVVVSDGHDSCSTALSAGSGRCTLRSRIAGRLELQARYAGDLRHAAAVATAAIDVTGAGSEPSQVLFFQPQSATSYSDEPVEVVVAVHAGSDPRASGRVTITDGDVSCAAMLDRAGFGRCTLRMQGAGTRTLTAHYDGDVRFAPQQASLTHAVQSGSAPATITAVYAEPEPVLRGQPYVVGAEIAGSTVVDGRTFAPGGVIRFVDGAANCEARIVAGEARCTLHALTTGVRTIAALYPGDRRFAAAQGSDQQIVLADHGTRPVVPTVLSDAPDASRIGQAFDVRVRVADQAGGTAPVGVVTVVETDESLRCDIVLQDGEGACTLVARSAGAKSLQLAYAGSVQHAPANAVEAHAVVDPRSATTTTIASHLPAATAVGQPYVVEAQVSGGASPSGTVAIDDGAAACEAEIANGTARCTLTARTAGELRLTARYGGDHAHRPSAGEAIHVVGPPTVPRTSVAVAIASHAPHPSAPGQSYQVRVSVIASDGGDPGGAVTISDGTAQCVADVVESSAGCMLASATAGDKTLTATYGGDARYSPGSSAVNHRVIAPSELTFRDGFE